MRPKLSKQNMGHTVDGRNSVQHLRFEPMLLGMFKAGPQRDPIQIDGDLVSFVGGKPETTKYSEFLSNVAHVMYPL